MIRFLLYIGLAVTPFLVLRGFDTGYPKNIFALGVAVSIAGYALLRGRLFHIPSKLILLLSGWLIVSTFICPKWSGLNLMYGGNVDGLWNFKALFLVMAYLIAGMAILSVQWTDDNIRRLLMIVSYSGFLMSLYVFFQAIGIDPMFHVKHLHSSSLADSPNIVGTLGHPGTLGIFLLLCLIPSIALKKNYIIGCLLIAIFLTHSHIVWGATILSLLFFVSAGNNKLFILLSMLTVLAVFCISQLHGLQDSGRFNVWMQIINDMLEHPNTLFTGFGIGSFSYVFSPIIHQQGPYWAQAHNEYLEMFWGAGIIGVVMLLIVIFNQFKQSWGMVHNISIRTLLTMFFAICVCAAGNFVWHLGVFQLYSIVIIGILISRKKEMEICSL